MPYRFAISLASPTEVRAVVNSGRLPHRGPAARAGWYAQPTLSALAKLSDLDYLSAATDSPAHARYEGLLVHGLTTTSEIGFWCWAGDAPASPTRASCRVLDADGVLDDLAMADIQGAPVAVRKGHSDGAVATSAPLARYVVERIEVVDDNSKLITLGDAHSALDEPITRGEFMPNLPTLAGKPVPVVIGAVASVPALPANSDGTVCFLGDTPLFAETVLDRGDAMEPGTWEMATDGQQLLMVSPPVGPVVCDVSSIGAGQQPATLVQLLTEVFRRREITAWSQVDAAAIDAATGYAGVGYYTAQATTARSALAAVLPSYGAWWWQDETGLLRFARVTDPQAYSGEPVDLGRGDLTGDIVVTPDIAPNLTRRMAYRANAQALGLGDLVSDLVDVPPLRRAELTSFYRSQVYAGGQLPQRYAHADVAHPIVSCFWRREDAQAEIDRIIALYGSHRMFASLRLTDPDLAPSPGQIVRLTYPRYGLQAGKQMLVRSRTRNLGTGDTTLILWG